MGLVCDVTAMGCVECNADSDCAPPERCGPDHACGSSVRDAGMDSSSAADGSVDASSDARIEASIDARVARDVGMDAAVETDAFVTRDDASFEDVGHDAPLAFDADIDAACPAGLAYCAGLCVDTASDPQNCGTCGNSCGPGGTCVATGCLCATGATLCGARCADVTRDHESCGACGHACAANERCVMSACVVSPLYHGWTSPLAGCSTTTYDSTAPTALGGSYPFNAGDANACRAWKLAATVCTTEPMMYIDAYNWTCPISGGFTDPVFGAYCLAPSPQYACSTCPGACNAMCIHSPLSLRNCMGMEIPQL